MNPPASDAPEPLSDDEIDKLVAGIKDREAMDRLQDKGWQLKIFIATITDLQESLAACRHQITLQMARVDRVERVADKFEAAAVFAVKRAETAETEVKLLRAALKSAQEMHETISGAVSKASCETQDNESKPWEDYVHTMWFDGTMASYRDEFAGALSPKEQPSS